MKLKNELLQTAYDNSYYTIIGCGGDIYEWQDGYTKMLQDENIGTIKEFTTFKGKDMNTEFNLPYNDKYPDDLTFLAFPTDNLDIGKLAILKLKLQDRWFDDIVDNLIK